MLRKQNWAFVIFSTFSWQNIVWKQRVSLWPLLLFHRNKENNYICLMFFFVLHQHKRRAMLIITVYIYYDKVSKETFFFTSLFQ